MNGSFSITIGLGLGGELPALARIKLIIMYPLISINLSLITI
jgi:hypothetical protein